MTMQDDNQLNYKILNMIIENILSGLRSESYSVKA